MEKFSDTIVSQTQQHNAGDKLPAATFNIRNTTRSLAAGQLQRLVRLFPPLNSIQTLLP
jgi:hypothetical protein